MNTPDTDKLPIHRLFKVVYWLVALNAAGTVGFMMVEGWSLADSFFMTVITISTVGYGEPHALTEYGRMFTSVLIFMSIVSMTGSTAVLTSFIVECNLGGHFQRRRTARMIESLKDHTIVCGTSLLAEAVIERLARKRVNVVVIGSNFEKLAHLKKRFRRILTIEGDASNELNLAKANVLQAKHVVAAMDAELDNLLIGITCKDMGHEIKVIAESHNTAIANRMRKSGVDEVISPSQLGGERVTELILS